MNQTLETSPRKTRNRSPVTVIVEREFVGDKTVTEALLPIIFEDLRHKVEAIHTFDTPLDST